MDPRCGRHFPCIPPRLDQRNQPGTERGALAVGIYARSRIAANRLRSWSPPREVRLTVETDTTETEYYRRRKNHIAVRHASGDALVAVVEIVSPGDKSSRTGLRSFVEKMAKFLERQIHLVILDVLLPTPRDPRGIEDCDSPRGLTAAKRQPAFNSSLYTYWPISMASHNGRIERGAIITRSCPWFRASTRARESGMAPNSAPRRIQTTTVADVISLLTLLLGICSGFPQLRRRLRWVPTGRISSLDCLALVDLNRITRRATGPTAPTESSSGL